MIGWQTAWTIARRDLSARFRGLRLLLVCLFLGVGALAAIGSLTGAIGKELSSRGRAILGGDVVDVVTWHIYPTDGTGNEADALASVTEANRWPAEYRRLLADDTESLFATDEAAKRKA